MDFNTYQSKARETAIYPRDRGVQYTVLGLANEAGEVAGVLKKDMRGDYSHQVTKEKLEAELGDVLWYLAMAAYELGVDLETIATKNIEKLQDRKARDAIRGSGDKR